MRFLTAVLLLFAVVASCKKVDLAELTPLGKWKLDNQTDVIYLEVTADSLFLFDYMGDEYDDLADCYMLDSIDYTYEKPWMNIDGDAWYATITSERLQLTLRASGVNESMRFVKAEFNASTFATNECTDEDLGLSKKPKAAFGRK